MTRNRMRTTVVSFIFCLICSSFIVSHTYCSEDSPYCTGDQERIQELTDEFIQTYGDEVEIRWNEDTGIPSRVRNVYPNPSDVDLDNPKGTALSFLSENSSFLGLDMDDLKYYSSRDITNGYRVDFNESYRGIRVEGGFVRVFIYDREDGTSLYIQSNYLACLDLDVDPTISSTEAANIVKKDLGVSRLITVRESTSWDPLSYGNPYSLYIPVQWEEVPAKPELLVFPFQEDGAVYLAWKIICVDEPFGRTSPSYCYFIDAHTGEIIKSGSMAISYGGDTSSSSTAYNPYNIPYHTPYNPTYTPYNPYTPYTPVYSDPYYTPYSTPSYNPYNTPYGTPYTPYSPSIGGNWLSGNYFNMMSNYNIFPNSSYFPTPGNIFQPTLSSSVRGLESYGNFINSGRYNPFLGGSNYFSPGNPFSYFSNPLYGFPY